MGAASMGREGWWAPPAAQPGRPRVRSGIVDRTAHPPPGRPSPAPDSASPEVFLQLRCRQTPQSGFGFGTHAKQRLTRQQCNSATALPHAAEQARHTSFPNRFPFVLRLTMSQVLLRRSQTYRRCTGWVVNGPSPGYPHVWSKHAGKCLPGCALEQIQATVQKEVKHNFRNLPRLG